MADKQGVQCYNCQKFGHFAKHCFQQKKDKAPQGGPSQKHRLQYCSGITPRYDKPSLKIGELSRTCQPLAQGGDKSRQTTQSHWKVLQAYVLYSRTRRGFNSEE